MLAQRSIPIEEQETAPELSTRLARLGAGLLCETLPHVELGDVERIPQNDAEASYAPLLKRDNGLIDWQRRSGEIANRVRAFQPWPGTYTNFRGARLIVWRAYQPIWNGDVSAEGGTILNIDDTGIAVLCGDQSVLLIAEIQLEGKRRVAAREFANGARLKPGDRINQ
jgi:methionyl-tRNA formyltransferase